MESKSQVNPYFNPDRNDTSEHEIRAANILIHINSKELATLQTDPIFPNISPGSYLLSGFSSRITEITSRKVKTCCFMINSGIK